MQKNDKMRVMLNRVLPVQENTKNTTAKPFIFEGRQYIQEHKKSEASFVGFPIYHQFICILPQPQSEYQYLKLHVRVEVVDGRKLVAQKAIDFVDIKRNDNRKDLVVTYIPPIKGDYELILQARFKTRNFILTAPPPQERRDSLKAIASCEDPFQVIETIITDSSSTSSNSSSVSFPLLVQYQVMSKVPDTKTKFAIDFLSENFKKTALHKNFTPSLQKGETFNALYQLDVDNMNALKERGSNLGTFRITYKNGHYIDCKTSLPITTKLIFFKAETITKRVPKKDIVQVRLKFSKVVQAELKMGYINLQIDEKNIPAGIKMIKMSQDRINLDNKMSEQIVLSLICLRSGFFLLTGLSLCLKDLKGNEDRQINFINALTILVENERQIKQEEVLEKSQLISLDFQANSLI